MKKYIENTNKKYAQKVFYKVGPVGGISLIVLVITIIVIIILASAVIVSLVNNNPITSASEARIKSDVSNMQEIFTNAVSKVMAESQDVIEITAGPLNTVTSGEKSAVGNAVYKLSDGTNGEVIFDTLPNEGLKYYTGKRLPIYNKKTTWYVDEDGIISLEVGDKKYGEGQIVKSIKIVASVIPSEEYIKTKATVKVEISSEEDIASIKFGGKDIEVPERKEGKYEVEIEVTENGTYEIEVSGVNGETNKAIVEVNEIDNLNEQIGIKETVTITEDYVKGNIGLEITYSKEIESIKINGESITVPNKVNGKYIVNKEVLENGEYKVEVKAKDGTMNKVVVKVTQITEDMDIWNRADMESFRDKVNSGRTFAGRTVRVRANIDLQGGDSNLWVPVGFNSIDVWSKPFKGTFEGNNFNINNLYINSTSDCQGLFGFVDNGTINNVRVSGVRAGSGNSLTNKVKGGNYVGAIVGAMNGIISNCKCNVIVEGTGNSIGGIAGHLNGSINNCTNDYGVHGNGNIGGIIGYHKGSIQDCTVTSGVTGSDNIGGIIGYKESGTTLRCTNNLGITGVNKVGGIVGYNAGTITDCKNTIGFYMGANLTKNTISGSNEHTGGIAGYSTGNITRCSNSATVQGTNKYAGGIVGYTESSCTTSYCYNNGEIKINIWSVGGITGWNYGPIYYCYNTNSVTCSSYYQPYDGSWAGGISGTGNNNIHYCYNIGPVYGYSRCVSGIAGGGGDNSMSIVNTYNAGGYSQTRSGHIGAIMGQNKGKATLTNSYQVSLTDLQGWDTNNINSHLTTNFVKDTNNINGGYPILAWQQN